MEFYEHKGKNVEITHHAADINKKLQEILDKGANFGPDFEFRPNQRKAVVKIAFFYLNNICKNIILDAPTGSGKSIIAIMTARLLREWKKEGYMITSNLDLQDQYMKDIHSFNLMWGSVKGVDNYNCDVNGMVFSLGECRSRGYAKQKIESLDCYTGCGYHMSKLRAQNSAIAILNYSYWLIQRNYVAQGVDGEKSEHAFKLDEPFKVRDFCFFDEAHRIDDIVQSHFSLTFTEKILDKMTAHFEYMDEHNMVYDRENLMYFAIDYNTLMLEMDYDKNVKAMRRIKKTLHELINTREILQGKIEKDHKFGQNDVPIYLRDALKRCELFKDVSCKLSDYLEIIEEDPACFVKTPDTDKDGNGTVIFNLLKDQVLLKKKLHSQSNFSIFMSATFGDPKVWAEMCGVDDYEIISVPNLWDLSKSPVYLSKKLPSLAFAQRDANIGTILKAFDELLDKHRDQKGIVHTGNFYFTKHILDNSKHKKRFRSYENSRGRAESIEKFKTSKNDVLIGPSLTEGLDLKDDMSRFQIFVKVPYRVTTDNYTKLRMENDRRWYAWKACLTFVQALGRSIRNENDWAVTYLLDGNFRDFFRHNHNMLPKHINDRVTYF